MQGHLNTDKSKWITIVDYVDVETGEIITKSEFEREYYTVKNNQSYEQNESYRIRRISKYCRKHGQLKIGL